MKTLVQVEQLGPRNCHRVGLSRHATRAREGVSAFVVILRLSAAAGRASSRSRGSGGRGSVRLGSFDEASRRARLNTAQQWIKKRSQHEKTAMVVGLCVVVLVSFAFPRLSWIGPLGYGLIALLLTQLVMIRKQVLSLQDRLYQALGIVALLAQLLWLLTPVRWESSGVPLVLSWSLLVGWSVIRLVERLASERRVTAGMLMGAAAGYLLLGLTAGLVMSAVETIQPGSFEPLDIPITDAAGQNYTVIGSAAVFAQINYFAFICLTTVGFGDINPELPLARILAVSTGIAGPLYLAVVMGVLIGRYAGDREIEDRLEQHDPNRR